MEYGVDIASADNTRLRGAASALREQEKGSKKLKKQAGKYRWTFEKDKSKAARTRTIEMCVRKWLCRQHF